MNGLWLSYLECIPFRLRLLPSYLVEVLLGEAFELDLALEAMEEAARLATAMLLVVEGEAFLDRLGQSCVGVEVAWVVCYEKTVREEALEYVLQLLKLFGLLLL